MNVLQFSISYSLNSDTIDSDMAEALVKAGHKVCALSMDPKFNSKEGEIHDKNGVEVLCVKTGAVQKVSKYKKGVNFLMLPRIVKKAVQKHWGNNSFDFILFEAPPVTLQSVIRWAKNKFNCPAYLMQKDIFPQNAVDLKFFGKRSLAYAYFRSQEKKMLKASDFIGCMSQANIDYIRKHNPYLNPECVEYFPNTKSIKPLKEENKTEIRKKYSLPQNACIFLFGGTMGKPQNVEIICKAMDYFNKDNSVFFLFIGSGTDANVLKKHIKDTPITNALFLDYMPRDDYEKILRACDVGLISLNPNFTIPNYPSKILSYMECSIPVVASLDLNTDYGKLLQKDAKCGYSSDASKPEEFIANLKKMSQNLENAREMGLNGRKYLEEHFDVAKSVKILEGHFLK